MIVCHCNALNEEKVAEALRAGAHTSHGVHRHHGAWVQCGMCLPRMTDIISQSAESLDAAPGANADSR